MLTLASSSITRANLLTKANINFIQRACEFDENCIRETDPKSFIYQATLGKLNAYKKSYANLPVLVADTVVVCENQILRKANSEQEAREILLLQSGNLVYIITCMMYETFDKSLIDISSTSYKFAKFDENKLNKYLKSKEWQGKAGACMVEGFCKDYIQETKGFQSTAMGLCVEKLRAFL